jgi:hypothetical protein
MEIRQVKLTESTLSPGALHGLAEIRPHLAFVFASARLFSSPALLACLAQALPGTRHRLRTAGEISNDGVDSGTAVITAVNLTTGFRGERRVSGDGGFRRVAVALAAAYRLRTFERS